ncbi:GspE/PulE family protein [Zhongshania marina]|uniref:General secretion pathway protein E n=1 Tax=Zhongshania marina TaxID=2304603 RepID=A0A2S4HCC5_9GAMM|nr:ATPase, T2SS/T4P/T4SS family [Marortus luteolus]POP51589.1 type II secretion system protein GspE [Marortus luteolus]
MSPALSEGEVILPYSYAKRHQAILLAAPNSTHYKLIFHQFPELPVLNEIQRIDVSPLVMEQVPEQVFENLLVSLYQQHSAKSLQESSGLTDNLDLQSLEDAIPDATEVLAQEDDAPIIKLISALIAEAIRLRASDIHLTTNENKLDVKFRIDGRLKQTLELDRALSQIVVSRIKVMAKLDIAEKRVPQDGRISIRIGGRDVDLRISTLPASFGERVVMRILDKNAGRFALEGLGLTEQNLTSFKNILKLPHGIVLITGPTGSGKSTTLYSGLSHINNGERNILTIEDPLEYRLDGISQTQVNLKTGMTFAKGLRSMLRQDPDVIMVGEIRDEDTIRVAIQASLTGHLVLSTLHTNTAIGAITRLEDMGVEPYLIASTLSAVIAQRLVRVLCLNCRQPCLPEELPDNLLRDIPGATPTIYKPNHDGCEVCQADGYKGRTAIYEVVAINVQLRKLIHDRRSEAELLEEASKSRASLYEDGLRKVIEGVTSIDEVLRVTRFE